MNTSKPATRFGAQLKQWRARAGLSQLELAAAAGTTSRHVSFLETGRSRPRAPLVVRLAAALEVPLRERNALLASAGLAAAYPTYALTDEAMQPVKRVLDRLLRTHEPFPAWVGGRGYRFFASNRAAEALFPGLCALAPEDIVDLWFGPGRFRSLVENWPDVVWAGVAGLQREAAATGDARLMRLARRAERHVRSLPPPSPSVAPDLPVVCPRFNVDGVVVRTISTVMRFDTAVEVSASELRVELMFPADDESEAFFRRVARR